MIRDPSNMADWTDVENIPIADDPASEIDRKLRNALDDWLTPPSDEASANSTHSTAPIETPLKPENDSGTVLESAELESTRLGESGGVTTKPASRIPADRRADVGSAPTHGSTWNWDRGMAGALHLGVSSPVARDSDSDIESMPHSEAKSQAETTKVRFFIPDTLIASDPEEESLDSNLSTELNPKPASSASGASGALGVESNQDIERQLVAKSGEGEIIRSSSWESDESISKKIVSNKSLVVLEEIAEAGKDSVAQSVSSVKAEDALQNDVGSSQPNSELSESLPIESEFDIDVIQSQDLEVIDAEEVLDSDAMIVESSPELPPPLQNLSKADLLEVESSSDEIGGEDILDEEDWEEVAVEEVTGTSVPPALGRKQSNGDSSISTSTVPPPARIPEQRVHRSWHIDAFEDYFSALRASDSMESAIKDARFIDACLSSPASATLLDVACGDGRHSFAFTDLGYEVTGIDNSAAQLRLAAANNEMRTRKVKFVSADMRSIPDATSYDIVLCLGSSLGFFDTDQNRMVLERMKGVLRPGGRMVLQVFNRDSYVSHLPCRSWWAGEGCLVLDEVEFDFLGEQLLVNRTVVFEDGHQVEKRIAIHAYTLQELVTTVEAFGLRVREISGSRYTRGCYYGAASPEIWLIAENS